MSLVSPGFAIRRESTCLSGLEVDCGATGRDGFHACCPSSLICPGPQYNAICCPVGDESCTEKALAEKAQPPCANATWDMFDNGGYFCCDAGVQGYNRSNTNWCGRPRQVTVSDVAVQTLSLVRGGVDPVTVVSASSTPASLTSGLSSASARPASFTSPNNGNQASAAVSNPPPTPEPSSSQSESSTPVGAIAGGVVGGIAALSLIIFLAWFFLRRRRQQRQNSSELHGDSHMAHEKDGDSYVAYEASGSEKYASSGSRGAVYEVGENEARMPVAEMPGNQRPVELDGMGTVR